MLDDSFPVHHYLFIPTLKIWIRMRLDDTHYDDSRYISTGPSPSTAVTSARSWLLFGLHALMVVELSCTLHNSTSSRPWIYTNRKLPYDTYCDDPLTQARCAFPTVLDPVDNPLYPVFVRTYVSLVCCSSLSCLYLTFLFSRVTSLVFYKIPVYYPRLHTSWTGHIHPLVSNVTDTLVLIA